MDDLVRELSHKYHPGALALLSALCCLSTAVIVYDIIRLLHIERGFSSQCAVTRS